MNKTFNLNETSKVFIYGCGTAGKEAADKLPACIPNIKGYIDRNAKNIKIFENYPVYDLETLKDVYEKDDVVIITLNNGLEHEKVAQSLFAQCGINKILYIPMHVQSTYLDRLKLLELYKKFFTFDFKKIEDIPVYSPQEKFSDEKIINATNGWVYFWCPICYIYDYWDYIEIDVKELINNSRYANFLNWFLKASMERSDFYKLVKFKEMKYDPRYISLYKWIEDDSADVTPYLKGLKYLYLLNPLINNTDPQLHLAHRRELKKVLEDALKYDVNFFTNVPATAYWGEEFFIIQDGRHRTHFLISRGYDRVPIRVTIKDFEQYIAYKEKLTKEKKNKLKTFNVSAKDTFIIYGAAHRGKDILTRLKNQGFSVECFLDKRADELVEVKGVKVIHPDNYSGNKENNVVVLAISDPVPVANRLKSLGFKKLIYKVFQVFQYKNLPVELKMMDKAFRQLMDGKMRGGGIENIPEHTPNMDIRFTNNAVIAEDADSVVVRVPLDLIFTKSDDRHVFMYNDFLNYIDAFSMQKFDDYNMVADYAKHYAIEKLNGWKETLTADERYTYTLLTLNEYNLYLDFGRDWFEDNPIQVTFDKNKFYIDDEYLFRVIFFISKGILHIPAKMSRKDYDAYINLAVVDKAVEYAKDYDLGAYSMIEHPYFYNLYAPRDIGGNSRFVVIGKFLDEIKLDVEGMNIVDVGAYVGIMSRFFARLGANVTSVEMNEKEIAFEAILNNLLHCENIERFCGVIQDFKANKTFDLAILMNVLHWHLTTGIAEEIVQAVDKITSKYLLWESGDNPSYEKELIKKYSSFSKYTKICTTIGTGRIRELGFWTK